MSNGIAERPDRAVHDMLTQRHSDAYEEWTRQDAVVGAIRAELGSGGGDEADRGSGNTQLEEQEAVAAALRRHLDDLALAIERSEAGTYGICVTCGGPIGDDRLELFPAAVQCVKCKQQAERQ
ncbi:MAG TPA: TraR/DksA C4-type zinc finger protein [Micromonosporaceae bacterium]|jgi:DnaK suppressor protein